MELKKGYPNCKNNLSTKGGPAKILQLIPGQTSVYKTRMTNSVQGEDPLLEKKQISTKRNKQ